jgi:hypothetical protein
VIREKPKVFPPIFLKIVIYLINFVILFLSSRTCPTCRHPATTATLIKLFFEFDDQKANLHLDDILKTNDELTHALNEAKEKSIQLEIELRETQAKLRESSANEKKLERQKQIDDMTIAGISGIKNESTKEIIKLNQQVNTLKLDLLAEKQLRRIHQVSLHDLKPDDDNYNPRSIRVDETDCSIFPSTHSIVNGDPSKISNFISNQKIVVPDQPKDTKPYIIPSKIQKSSNKEIAIKAGRLMNFKNHRSIWNKSDKKPVGFQFLPPTTASQSSTSSAAILSKNQKRAFGEGLVFTAPIAAATTSSSTGSSFFNFSIDSPTFPLVSSSSGSTSTNFVMSTPLSNYREIQEVSPPPPLNGLGGPKISDR